MKRIYLDYAAATPLDGRAQKAMEKYWAVDFANPSSIHRDGIRGKEAVEGARKKIAEILGCRTGEIIFTSGGTESDNMALFGAVYARHNQRARKGHIITTTIEHSAVLEPCKALEREGFRVSYVSPDSKGIIHPQDIARAMRPDTILISVAYASSRVGTIQPIRDIAKIKGNALFHTDACQATNFLTINIDHLGVDLMSISSPKVYGPKGAGALYKKRNIMLLPYLYGGGQEYGFRSGTENVPAIVGFAEALTIARKIHGKESARLIKLRDYVIAEMKNKRGISLEGHLTMRLPNHIGFSFLKHDAESVILKLDARGIAASAGSACSAKAGETSRTVRLSLGRTTTKKDLEYVIIILCEILKN